MEKDRAIQEKFDLFPIDFVDEDSDDEFDWDSFGAPESLIVRSKEELYARLEKSEEDFLAGRTINAEDLFKEMREKYGFSR